MSRTRSATAAAAARTETTHRTQTGAKHTARYTVHWGRSGAVIAVNGEIDAANAKPLADYVQSCAERCEWLVLDLADLEFIGTAGFSALQAISARCAQTDICWTVVPGLAVSTLLRVCDPEARLPIAGSLTTALADVQDRRPVLRPVP